MVDRLFDIANSAARRLGDMFDLAPARPDFPQQATAQRPDFFGQGPAQRPDFYAGGVGPRPSFFSPVDVGRPDFYGQGVGQRPDFYSGLTQSLAATAAKTSGQQAGAQAAGALGGAGVATTGLPPAVAQWAGQVNSTFGDLGGWVPAAMLAIIQHESSGKPTAYNSDGNAYGLFQQVGLGSYDPNTEFSAARQLAQQKLTSIQNSYAANGLNPDDRTRARDLFLAWAGHFDYASGQPNPNSRDIGSGQDYNSFLNQIMPMYDNIVAGQHPSAGGAGRQPAGSAIARAQGLIGTPYELGGLRSHPGVPNAGIDCSELTGYALGLDPSMYNAQSQYDHAQKLDPSQVQAGDLVFFTGTDPSNNQPITHVGLYIGNGQMIDAEDGGVLVASLSSQYWRDHLAGYGRL